MMNRNILNPMMWTTGSGPTPPVIIKSPGIYWNQSLGLITLSEDGENWITISDKNLGATIAFNLGDVISDTNAGGFFQSGNNYMFPGSGTVTTSHDIPNGTNYGPYYESDIFRTITNAGDIDWSTVINENLWGEKANRIEAMQGPCSEGFHVPKVEEYETMMSYIEILAPNDWYRDNWLITYLKMPKAGERNTDTGEVASVGVYGRYWTCSSEENDGRRAYYFSPKYPSTFSSVRKYSGYSIRPFKDYAAVPDSTWTKLYGTSIESGGIFRSESFELISISSDGTNRITMSDKNLGATVVYTYGDELTQANCGKFYQRGNNYGFPRSGEIRTSSTQVDATNYGPYYYNDIFYLSQWVGQTYPFTNENMWGNVTGTNKARRGPCPEGFHVPTNQEYQTILNIFDGLVFGLGICGEEISEYLKLPFCGLRTRDGGIFARADLRGFGSYKTCSMEGGGRGRLFFGWSGSSDPTGGVGYNGSVSGGGLRMFKNIGLPYDDGWTKIYDIRDLLAEGHLEYDFRGGSLPGFKSAGFDTIYVSRPYGGYTIDSDGLYMSAPRADIELSATKRRIDLSNANKITITQEGYYQTGLGHSFKGIRLFRDYQYGGKKVYPALEASLSYRWAGYCGLTYYTDSSTSTGLRGESLSLASGQQIIKLIIDFNNKTITSKFEGTNNYEYTAEMTDELEESIRTMGTVCFRGGEVSTQARTDRIQKISIDIE